MDEWAQSDDQVELNDNDDADDDDNYDNDNNDYDDDDDDEGKWSLDISLLDRVMDKCAHTDD